MTLPGLPSSPPVKTYRNSIQLYEELLKVPTASSSKLDGFTDDEWVEKERGGHRGGIVNAKRKTELCRNWLNGFWYDFICLTKVANLIIYILLLLLNPPPPYY